MALCVLDASVAIAFAMPDEISPPDALFLAIHHQGAVVAQHWPFEVCNTLLTACRLGRIDMAEMKVARDELQQMNVDVDLQSARSCWFETSAMASELSLTIYDAAYLELARRRQLPLATLDQRLAIAARICGIEVL